MATPITPPENPFSVQQATLLVLRDIRDKLDQIAENTGKTPRDVRPGREKAAKSAPVSIDQNKEIR
jgi:hypothetical protein